MRSISFALTIPQFRDGTKDVTRRLGSKNLKVGTILKAVDRVMGFKKGEHSKTLGVIKVTSVRREPLDAITEEECAREGFPDLTPEQFVDMFCQANKIRCSGHKVTRIEFVKLQDGPQAYPFHCGSQFADWESWNCSRCKKWRTCVLSTEIETAYGCSGSVTVEIADEIGYYDNYISHIWDCPKRPKS